MLETLNAFLWGPGTLALILGTGAWLTLRTGGFPQRNLGQALALSLGRDARRKGVNGVSPFGSLMTALATTVGKMCIRDSGEQLYKKRSGTQGRGKKI